MTIKEIEQATGLPLASVRYYESERLISPGRGDNGYRNYSQDDLDNLLKIKLLRQLHISLEEIQALKNGTADLNTVLDRALETLDRETEELDHARDLCRILRQDNLSYAQLKAQPYLNRLEQTVPSALASVPPVSGTYDQLQDGSRCPFRRWFARNFDQTLYLTLFLIFAQLVFKVNISSGSIPLSLGIFAVPQLLMLVLEPLMLHFFCTTPGKFLFGLKITRGDGSPLSLKDAFQRTKSVMVRGMGLSIPGIATLTYVYALYQLRQGNPMSWDYDLEDVAYWDGTHTPYDLYWEYLSSYVKALAASLLVVAMILMQIPCAILAMAPEHQGNRTVEQFVDNFNQYQRFHLSSDSRLFYELTANGTFRELTYSGAYYIDVSSTIPVTFEFHTENGIVKEVSFSASSTEEIISIPYNRMQAAIWSLLYGQENVSVSRLVRLHGKQLPKVDPQKRGQTDVNRVDLGGAVVEIEYFYEGYSAVQGMMFAQEGEEPVCTVNFSVRLAD